MAGGTDVVHYIEAGLKASSTRGRVIAGNIANLNTRGFRRSEVAFEETLRRLIESGGDAGDLEPTVFQPRTTPINEHGSDVNMDLEVGQMIQNGLKGKVYMRTLAKLYDQMELAIRDRV